MWANWKNSAIYIGWGEFWIDNTSIKHACAVYSPNKQQQLAVVVMYTVYDNMNNFSVFKFLVRFAGFIKNVKKKINAN